MSPSPSLESRVTRLETTQEYQTKDLDKFENAANSMEKATETLSKVVTQLDKVSERLTAVEEKLRDETLIRTYRNNHIRNVASGLMILVMLWSDKLGDAVNQFGELVHRWLR